MKKENEDDSIDWDDDQEPDTDGTTSSTLWGETRINEVIHEANQQQRDPEQYIKDKKSGKVAQKEDTAFRTVYHKEKKTWWQRLLARLKR